MANRLPPPPVFHRPSPRGSGSRSNTSSSTSHGVSSSSTNSPSRMMAIRGGGGSGTSSTTTTTMMTTTPEQDELTNKLEALLMSPEQDDDIDASTNENDGSTTKKNNQFSVAKYLNLALSNDALLMTSTGGRSLSSVDVTQLQQTKMAELALQLQLESQKCHNTIEQIGLDLINGILPRCDSDITRLKVGLDGLKQDTTHLYKESKPFVLSRTQVPSILVDGNALDGTTTNKETKDSSGTTTVTSPRSAVVAPSPVVVNAQSPPLELLTTLHALKKNLTLTKSILSAASSWDATVSTIPALLSPPTDEGSRSKTGSASGTTSIANLMEAVQALSTLEHGARALRGLPGVEERDSILSAVRSKIEILLRPKLLHALQQSRSVTVGSSAGSGSNSNLAAALSALQQVANMYKLLGKTEMLQTEYVKARPAAIHKAWFSFKGGVGIGVGGAGAVSSSSKTVTSTIGGRSSKSSVTKKKKKKKVDDEAENYDIQFDDSDDDEEKDDDVEDDEMNTMVAESSTSPNQQQSFVTWTQEWYESILVLLSEERRRTMSVFGADMSREIIAKILAECFRPLLSSYSSRLETLFSSNITRLTQQQPSSSSSSIQSYSSSVEYPSSFAAVCAVYESTLRFLSMVYDANLQGIPLKTVKQIFVNVTSPYAPYQQQYATLEQYYCQYNYNTKYTSLLQEMKQQIGEGIGRHGGARHTTNDEDDDQETYALTNLLVDTSERMSYLTVELFPIVEGCLGRYELLNCGYNASAAMETIDAIMSRYITTLSNAVDSLTKSFTAPPPTSSRDGSTGKSSTTSSGEEWMAKQFDEQHVQYALELFQSIGRMNLKLVQFQQRTRDRLKSLCSGMRASIHFDEDSSTTDSLSLVEVAALLSREVLLVGGNSATKASGSSTTTATLIGLSKTNTKSTATKPMTTASTIAQLQYLSGESRTRSGGGTTSNTTTGLPSLYPQSFMAMEQLSKSGQRFVFDILCCVPRMWLRSVASMPVWRGSGGASDALGSAISSFAGALGGGGGATDSYNKLPQPYITQVGEHVLALVQALEPFASNSESLALVKDVMSGLPYSVASQPWNDMVSATGCGINVERDVNVMKSLMKGKVLKQHPWILLGNNAQHHGYYEDDDNEEEAEEEQDTNNNNDHHERDAEQFCNEWLNVVCLAVTGRYLQGILRIARLSNHGRAHMEADINYILNVFSAIGIPGHPHPLLVHVLEIISMDRETLSLRIDQMSNSTSNSEGSNETNDKIFKLLKSMEQQLASMRGIGIH